MPVPMPGVRKTENVNATSTFAKMTKQRAPLAGTVILLTFFHFNYITDGCVLFEHTFSLISLWHRFVWRCVHSLCLSGTSTTIFPLLKLNVYPDRTNNLLHRQLR